MHLVLSQTNLVRVARIIWCDAQVDVLPTILLDIGSLLFKLEICHICRKQFLEQVVFGE